MKRILHDVQFTVEDKKKVLSFNNNSIFSLKKNIITYILEEVQFLKRGLPMKYSKE